MNEPLGVCFGLNRYRLGHVRHPKSESASITFRFDSVRLEYPGQHADRVGVTHENFSRNFRVVKRQDLYIEIWEIDCIGAFLCSASYLSKQSKHSIDLSLNLLPKISTKHAEQISRSLRISAPAFVPGGYVWADGRRLIGSRSD